jgi:hypothetical protein
MHATQQLPSPAISSNCAVLLCAVLCRGVYTSKLAYTLVGLITHLRLGVLAQRRVESALRMLQGATLAVSCAVIGLVVAVGLTKAVFEHKRPVAGDAKKHGECVTAVGCVIGACDSPHKDGHSGDGWGGMENCRASGPIGAQVAAMG